MLIGEVKEIAPARFGHRMVVKHVPKFPFMLNDDVHRRMTVKFADELSLWGAMPEAHLIAIATFRARPHGRRFDRDHRADDRDRELDSVRKQL